MADNVNSSEAGSAKLVAADLGELTLSMDQLAIRTRDLESSANSFARAMSQAFTQAASGAKQFDDVLKSLALRLSGLVLTQALKPVTSGLLGGLDQLFTNNSSGLKLAAAMGAIKPFAAGGVIGTPTYFPLASGGVGLAGEAGPEAILPLARGADGRLGVAASGAVTNVTVQIATPDAESFRRSETYVAGQIARAVARGQRSL